QAEDGIRYDLVTGVQTCALPIFQGSLDFAYTLLLLCEEASLLHYSRDHFDVNWYPTGFSIIEQGEVANSLYLVLSGKASVLRERSEERRVGKACVSREGEERDK